MRTTLRTALLLAAVLAAAPASAAPAPRPLDQAGLRKAVSGLKGAFTACVNRAASKGQGKVAARKATLRLTVLPTGRVGATTLDPEWLQGQQLGRCLTGAGRRLVIAPFAGAAVDVDVPLSLTVAK